jgi:transposase-like protein
MAKGRPSKLTVEVQMRVCEALRGGNYRDVAAQWAGISPSTLAKWLKKKDEKHLAFQRAVEEAERAAEVRAVAIVMKAASSEPRHAQWWLERKYPERWGRRDRHEVMGDGGGPVRVEHGVRVFLPAEEPS